MLKLKWKRSASLHKDLAALQKKVGGPDIDMREVYADHEDTKYSIRFFPNKHLNTLVDCILFQNGSIVYTKQVHLDTQPIFTPPLTTAQETRNTFSVSDAKDGMKALANLLVNGAKSAYKATRKTIPKELREKFDYAFKEVNQLSLFPLVKFFDKKVKGYFVKQAKAGLSPLRCKNLFPDNKYVKGNADVGELCEETITSLGIELWPIWFPAASKIYAAEEANRAHRVTPEKVVTPSRTKTPKEKPESYSGAAPRKRNSDALKRLATPTARYPCPDNPEDAKFSTLLKWAEDVRDYWEGKGKFPAISYLLYAARHGFKHVDRGIKAERRLRLIFADEAARHEAYMTALTEKKQDAPKDEPGETPVKKKVGKDKWGFKMGTRASNINLVITKEPKTIKQILKDAKEVTAGSHISSLIRLKWVKKLPDGKIRIRKGKKGAK